MPSFRPNPPVGAFCCPEVDMPSRIVTALYVGAIVIGVVLGCITHWPR